MSRRFAPTTIVRRSSRTVWRVFGNEAAIIDPSSPTLRTLNRVGARFWELADGRTLGDITSILLNEFEVEGTQLEADLQAFLAELDERNLLEVSDA